MEGGLCLHHNRGSVHLGLCRRGFPCRGQGGGEGGGEEGHRARDYRAVFSTNDAGATGHLPTKMNFKPLHTQLQNSLRWVPGLNARPSVTKLLGEKSL